ncbi:hypothetical protein [Candidatus Amarobacter glycogenicus]|uniref:hypothetical protein n=1 Tax=Candidatus Amarobacter glycogenicus TaxID=3140699 RepID=UPI0031CC94DF
MAIVDSSGNSQKSYTYDVYGEATPSGGPANEFDFAGQQTDGTGLQYLRPVLRSGERDVLEPGSAGVASFVDDISLSVRWRQPNKFQ